RYFLRVHLENSGFWNPVFSEERQTLVARTGDKLTLDQLIVIGSPIDIDISKYWFPRGKPLTPELLNRIESWLLRRLSENGYPCAELRTVASRADGKVRMEVLPGEHWVLKKVNSRGIPGLLGGVERRF